MIGTVLGGRYTILEEVGNGGMAHVYKAQCNVLNRIVAVKVLRNDLEGGEEFVNRFKAEAQSAACLTHPNIVSIYDVGEEDNRYYIVMEYIEGITLKEYIKQKGKLPSRDSASIASQICGALSVAHEKNIIHRDIKPHNIMITANGLVKVTDFGIARASNNSTMRVADSILGSVHYISPEQARGGYVDCRSDIYSLGIVLYEMLTGKVPFECDSPIAVAMKHLEEIPVSPSTLAPDVTADIEEIVLKAISKETRKRYQNAEEFKSALDSYLLLLMTGNESDDAAQVGETIEISSNVIHDFVNQQSEADVFDANDDIDEDASDENTGATEDTIYYSSDEENDEIEQYGKKRSRLNMIITAVLIAFFVVGAGFLGALYFVNPDAQIFVFFKNADVDVPDFTNMQFEKAQEIATQHGLILDIGDEKPSPSKEGTVLYQSVSEGNSVKKGTHITVHVSAGAENVDTDSYRGQSKDVIDEFREKGYDVTEKYVTHSEIPEDKIIRVKRNGNTFVFTISLGKEMESLCVVPDVRDCTVTEARKRLESVHLLLDDNITYTPSKTVEPDHIVEQSVAPGEKVPAKAKVSVVVALKEETKSEEPKEKPVIEEPVKEQPVKEQPVKEQPAGNDTTVEKIFRYPTAEKLTAPTTVKIVEIKDDNTESVLFEELVDPATLPEITLKVTGTGASKYTVYHDGEAVHNEVLNFTN